MELRELRTGDKLHVTAKLKKGRLEFDTQIVHQDSFGSVIQVIHHGNRIVNFSIPNIQIELVHVQSNGKPVIWSDCQIKTMIFKGRQIQIASTETEGIEKNRREAFRMGMGISGMIKIGNAPQMEAYINDVSYYGFGIVLPDDIPNSLNAPVQLSFTDESISIDIEGIIVRKQHRADEQIHFGCRVTSSNTELTKLISIKQRKRAHLGKVKSMQA